MLFQMRIPQNHVVDHVDKLWYDLQYMCLLNFSSIDICNFRVCLRESILVVQTLTKTTASIHNNPF